MNKFLIYLNSLIICVSVSGKQILIAAKPPLHEVVQALPPIKYNPQMTRISGRIEGLKSEMINNSSIWLTFSDMVSSRIDTLKIPIAADGSFSGETIVPQPSLTAISSNFGLSAPIFVIPGKNVELVYDINKKNQYLARLEKGKSTSDSQYLFCSGSCLSGHDMMILEQAKANFKDYSDLFSRQFNMTPDEYKKYVLDICHENIEYLKQLNCSDNAKTMYEARFKSLVVLMLSAYNHLKLNSNMPDRYEFIKDTAFYADGIKDLLDENNQAYVVDYLRRIELFWPTAKLATAGERFADFKKKLEPIIGNRPDLFELAKAHFYNDMLRERPFTANEKSEIQADFSTNPAYIKTLMAANAEVEQKLAALMANKNIVVNETPKVPSDQMFKAITSKYIGKAVLIDFWATWCGPCLMAHKQLEPLKEELNNKDVVFVYITNPSSPRDEWQKLITSIHGEHYRIDFPSWTAISQQFNIQAIPAYIIVNKKGEISYSTTGFPGVDTIKEELIK